jgi:hypothetical protein
MLDDSATLGEARKLVEENLDEGIECPCCTQFARRYNRKLVSGMARSLIDLYKQSSGWGEFVHVTKIRGASQGGGSFSLLRYWGLISEAEKTTTETRTSGMWSITDRGKDFVKNQIRVPSYCVIFDGTVEGFTGDMIGIKEALNNKFDYAELMGFELPMPKRVRDIMNEDDQPQQPKQESLL